MMTNFTHRAREISRILWVRALSIGLLAVLAAVLTPFLGPYVPESISGLVDKEGVNRVLDSLATALLTVTTFSVSVMVAVRTAATDRWSPRYLALLSNDPVTQNVLATFIGTYIFSLTAIILSNTGPFSQGGYAIIFALTVFTIVLVIVAILRWVSHLQSLGSLAATCRDLANTISKLLTDKGHDPCWGANRLDADAIASFGDNKIDAQWSGYLTSVRLEDLQKAAKENGARIALDVRVGDYIRDGQHIGYLEGDMETEEIGKFLTFAEVRTFDQDARFAISTLSEIAVKALSPSVNDPSSAMDVITWIDSFTSDMDVDDRAQENELKYPDIWLRPTTTMDLFGSSYFAIARYAMDHYNVVQLLLRILHHHRKSDTPQISEAASAAYDFVFDAISESKMLEADRKALQEEFGNA